MKVLFVAPRFPEPPVQGDRLRAFFLLQELRKRHTITLLAPAGEQAPLGVSELCDHWEPVTIARSQRALAALRGIAGRLPLQTQFFCPPELCERAAALQRAEHFDMVHIHTARMAPAAITQGARVLDYVDALSLNMIRRARREEAPARWALAAEGQRMQRYEQDLARYFDWLFVSSPVDRAALGAHEHIGVVPNGVDLKRFSYTEGGRDACTLMFTGRMSYFPNADAACFLALEVLPLVRKTIAEARLEIVGADPPATVRQLNRLPNVVVTGQVADMAGFLRRGTLAVAPLRSGTGIQNKVLEAMASGTPVVATPLALGALEATADLHALVAEEPAGIAAAIVRLLRDPPLRLSLARQARALVERLYTWGRVADLVEIAYDSALQRAHARGPQGQRWNS